MCIRDSFGDRFRSCRDDGVAAGDLYPGRLYAGTHWPVLQLIRLHRRFCNSDEHVRLIHDDAHALFAISQAGNGPQDQQVGILYTAFGQFVFVDTAPIAAASVGHCSPVGGHALLDARNLLLDRQGLRTQG